MEKTFTPDNYKLSYSLNQEKKTFREYLLNSAEIPLLTDLIRIEKKQRLQLNNRSRQPFKNPKRPELD